MQKLIDVHVIHAWVECAEIALAAVQGLNGLVCDHPKCFWK